MAWMLLEWLSFCFFFPFLCFWFWCIKQLNYPVRSVESPVSTSSLKNCSKETLDCQPPSLLGIDGSLSPTSLGSVVIAERDAKNEKYASGSPINSAECLEADQVLLLTLKIITCFFFLFLFVTKIIYMFCFWVVMEVSKMILNYLKEMESSVKFGSFLLLLDR